MPVYPYPSTNIALGVDDVFVFVNTYRQYPAGGGPVKRISHTVWSAGRATFFTSATTAAAFAANVGSSVR